MANRITNLKVQGSVNVQMSNSLTSVLFDVLALAACDLARTPWEHKLAYWLVQHDQGRTGLGMVGFDISDLGFSTDEFAEQTSFIVSVIDAALNRHGWDRLPFSPYEENLFDALNKFRALVLSFPESEVVATSLFGWVPNDSPEFGRCEVHQVYLHELGCIICNDPPIDAPPHVAPHRS